MERLQAMPGEAQACPPRSIPDSRSWWLLEALEGVLPLPLEAPAGPTSGEILAAPLGVVARAGSPTEMPGTLSTAPADTAANTGVGGGDTTTGTRGGNGGSGYISIRF